MNTENKGRFVMRKKARGLFIVVLVVLSLALVGCATAKVSDSDGTEVGQPLPSGPAGPTAPIQNGSQQTGVWVNGEGKVSAEPDLAILTLGIEAQAETVDRARTQAADAMDQVMQSLRKSGVAERDIQTTRFSIFPVRKWDRETEEEILVGFRVSNMVTAKMRDIEETGPIIDSVAEAGGDLTRIQGIAFTIEDPEIHQVRAREEAVAIARAKAEQLAHMAGARLGVVTYINESGGYYPVPVAVPAMDEAVSLSTLISPGEQEITVSVQIAYTLEME